MNTSQMNDEEMHLLTSIHNGIFPKREKGFEKRGFSNFNNAKSKSKSESKSNWPKPGEVVPA